VARGVLVTEKPLLALLFEDALRRVSRILVREATLLLRVLMLEAESLHLLPELPLLRDLLGLLMLGAGLVEGALEPRYQILYRGANCLREYPRPGVYDLESCTHANSFAIAPPAFAPPGPFPLLCAQADSEIVSQVVNIGCSVRGYLATQPVLVFVPLSLT
jgi:hypothetical protein